MTKHIDQEALAEAIKRLARASVNLERAKHALDMAAGVLAQLVED